jgi:POT family proton-dependent oligopeptide transporter
MLPIKRPFLHHPRGLFVCCATEFWERFSYYGMRSLLVFYLMQRFSIADSASYLIYGTYSATVYLTPVLGGIVADRFIGARRAVTLGALLLVCGHFGLALEGIGAAHRSASESLLIFYFSLALIATGVGFLKTNATTLVGALYSPDDPRRDAGFTIFYMVYNIGAAAAPLLCGWVGTVFGWNYGFGLAGLGMLMGLWTFLSGQRELEVPGKSAGASSARPEAVSRKVEVGVYVGAIATVVAIWTILRHPQVMGPMLTAVGGLMSVVIIYQAFARCPGVERERLLVCATLLLFTIGFWAIYEQVGSSMNVFSERFVDRSILGYNVPAATLQSLPPIFVIAGAPLMNVVWLALARYGYRVSYAVKFALGIALLGSAFLLLACGASRAAGGHIVGIGWFIGSFLLLAAGELCVAPVSMAMVTELAPQGIVGMMTGALFLAYSASGYLSGRIAQMTSATTVGGLLVDRTAALENYSLVYTRLGGVALAVATLLLLLSPLLRRRVYEGSDRECLHAP